MKIQRKKFIEQTIKAVAAMTTLAAFRTYASNLEEQPYTMPALFIGHGSPMNGIEDNAFSQRWTKIAEEIPVPNAVLVVSAHWFTRGTRITAMDFPKTIHDFGGFPQALFDVQYNAPGSPAIAKETSAIIKSTNVVEDHDWGLDHGTWTVVRHMYPKADIPVLQISIDYTKSPAEHYAIGKELQALRRKGILVIGSGNMVHNLRMLDWRNMETPNFGFDWAVQMNTVFKDLIERKNHQELIAYEKMGREAKLAIPTPEHYLPLLYTLGMQSQKDKASFFNDVAVGGSLTMTSVKLG